MVRQILILGLFLCLTALADPVQDWLDLEQLRIDRTVDERKIQAPDIKNQKVKYRPENQNWYSLKAVWVPAEELNVAIDESQLPAELKNLFVRERKGKLEYRLLVHPESERFYKEILKKYPAEEETFRATSTASSRTVLVEAKGKRFFAKLSLDVELGGVTRTVPSGEVARSVGTSIYLSKMAAGSQHFGFLSEPFGIAPKGWERGGMIIRTIPSELFAGETKLVPLFSLYAKAPGGETLLESLARREKMEPEEFVKKFILKPFHQGWADWNFNKSVTMEAHAQNVLLELDANGKPTGRFVHRDLGGFNIDLSEQKAMSKKLPVFSTLEQDYHQKFVVSARRQSLHTYFDGGFLFNVNRELKRIQPGYRDGQIYHESRKILAESIFETTGVKVNPAEMEGPASFSKTLASVSARRAGLPDEKSRLKNCVSIFGSMRR